MGIMWELIATVLIATAWVGHACIWVSLLNNLYGRALNKRVLKVWRLLSGLLILAFPLLIPVRLYLGAQLYLGGCVLLGGVIFPIITLLRLLRPTPACVLTESTQTVNLWPILGQQVIGDGFYRAVTQLPGNGVFRVDLTDLTLALPKLPPEWEGLRLHVLSDLHFHGTPSRDYFDWIVAELRNGPQPDLVCLVGDYVDTDTHHTWIAPVLEPLPATEAKLAILGNHDLHHHPERLREELVTAGYTVLGNNWQEVTIRGVPCVVAGHEGPWFAGSPDLGSARTDCFRLCLSHTPDNFYWGIANHIDLMLCGHVHGGAVRVPVVGSIFVPSIYGRRFDRGVFEQAGTVMVVNRGLSGKEPLRLRCHPQVLRITLVRQRLR